MRNNDGMASPRPRLCEARLAAGLTQQELADRLGVAQTVIARWESGTREPRVYAAVRVSEALGTTANAIWLTPDPDQRGVAPRQRPTP
jgi:transcriptional regulator with XRE-family HTH domain